MDMSSLVRGRRWRSISSLWYDGSHAHRVVSRILCLDLGGGFFLFLEYHCGFYVLSLPFAPVTPPLPIQAQVMSFVRPGVRQLWEVGQLPPLGVGLSC